MKNTIFEKGNKLRNKFHRAMAWARVKKYWLFMSRKEYKRNIFYNIVGMIVTLVGLYFGAMYLIGWVITKISDLYYDRWYKKHKEEKSED